MNNKITIVDRNGNQIVAQAVSYITLSGNDINNEYLFYTLNEVVNGDLSKIYVAKVNSEDLTITDPEWENVKRAMLAIVHQEEVIGLSYNSIVDEQGLGKTFNIDLPRKIALKMDKLIGLQDEYKLALSNPQNTSDTPAVGNTEFFDKSLTQEETAPVVENVPNAFDGSMNATSVPGMGLPTGPIAPVTSEPVAPVTVTTVDNNDDTTEGGSAPVAPVAQPLPVTVEPVAPVQEQTAIPAVQPANTAVTVETVAPQPAEEPIVKEPTVDITPTMPNIVPASIPSAIKDGPAVIHNSVPVSTESTDSNDYAIPVNKPVVADEPDMDSVIFDQIIQELNQIKTQNAEIRESIRRLTDNVANINTTLTTVEMNNQQGNYNGMINTNMANTTEDVSAININPSGQVILPSINQEQQNAAQAANVLTTNVIEQVAPETQFIEQPVIQQPEVIEQPVIPESVQPQVIEQPVIPEPVQPQIIEQPVIPEPVQPQVVDPAVVGVPTISTVETIQPTQPAVIEQPVVDQTPQILPDVPVMGVNVPQQEIVVPEFDPNAGLPPVVMPMGVSAENDGPAIGGSIVNPLADGTQQ